MPEHYNAAGAAAADSLNEYLLKQAAEQRAALKQAHDILVEDNKQRESASRLKIDQDRADRDSKDAEREHIVKAAAGLVIGDPIPPALQANADRLGVPLRREVVPPPVESIPIPKIIQEMGGPVPKMEPMPAGAIRFGGSPQQVKDKQTFEALQDARNDASQDKITAARIANENKVEAAKLANENKEEAARQAALDRAALAKIVHANSGSAHEDTRRDNNYKSAITELEKATQPITAQVGSINDLGIMLNQRTPQADALIAPMVLKSTISGTGSGFRMTQAEINQVIGGRSKWDSLSAALNKWQTDPSKALSITDPQRDQLRSLAKAIRTKATKRLAQVQQARHDLDDADGVDSIHRIMTKVKEDLYKDDVEPDDSSAASGIPEVGGMFNGGKVLKVTPVK